MANFGPSVETFNPSNRIKTLSNQASTVKLDPAVQIKRYFRSSLEVMRMAKVYYAEGSLEQAFVLYQKYLSLTLEHLPKHPGYPAADPEMKKIAKRNTKEIMQLAEDIHNKIKLNYEKVYIQKQHEESVRLLNLRQEEERRLEAERRIQEENNARHAAEEEARRKKASEEEDRKFAMYLTKELEKEEANGPAVVPLPSAPSAPPSEPVPVIPPVLPPNSQQQVRLPSTQIPYPQVVPGYQPPQPSPAPHTQPTAAPHSQPAGLMPVLPPSYGDAMSSPAMPSVDRSTKPVHFTQTQSDMTSSQNKYGLKPVRVPISISQRFAESAKSNTLRNIETCGILFGKLERNSFLVTNVLIPNQKGAPDSCDLLHEEELYEYADKHELLQLGWIHTHPSQTAFLSSVDLHTHCNIQLLMPEAIAIVVSPKYDEVGIFHLTPEYGLDYITKCTKGGFHPHPKDPALFQSCEPVHVMMDPTFQAVFTDIRR